MKKLLSKYLTVALLAIIPFGAICQSPQNNQLRTSISAVKDKILTRLPWNNPCMKSVTEKAVSAHLKTGGKKPLMVYSLIYDSSAGKWADTVAKNIITYDNAGIPKTLWMYDYGVLYGNNPTRTLYTDFKKISVDFRADGFGLTDPYLMPSKGLIQTLENGHWQDSSSFTISDNTTDGFIDYFESAIHGDSYEMKLYYDSHKNFTDYLFYEFDGTSYVFVDGFGNHYTYNSKGDITSVESVFIDSTSKSFTFRKEVYTLDNRGRIKTVVGYYTDSLGIAEPFDSASVTGWYSFKPVGDDNWRGETISQVGGTLFTSVNGYTMAYDSTGKQNGWKTDYYYYSKVSSDSSIMTRIKISDWGFGPDTLYTVTDYFDADRSLNKETVQMSYEPFAEISYFNKNTFDSDHDMTSRTHYEGGLGGTLVAIRDFYVYSTTSGLEETLRNTTVNVYPNPFTGRLTITSNGTSETKWIVLDVTGKEVSSGHFDSGQKTIELNQIPSGLYFLRLDHGTGTETMKVVKE